jgi:dTDP-4-amino-4,6-dideoxygalactose transaminase
VIYVIHYFGFAQALEPVVELCRNKGLYLVEDCALSLLTEVGGRRIGTQGDLAIYNFPKVLPVPDGGALVVNNPELQGGAWTERTPGMVSIMGNLSRLFRQSLLRGLPEVVVRRLFATLRGSAESQASRAGESRPEMPRSYYFGSAMRDRKISAASRWLMARMDFAEIRLRRRLNYSLLLKQLSQTPGVQFLFDDLPAGVCPLCLPILVRGARQMARKLTAMSIPAIPWWKGYHRSFPDAGGFEEAGYLKDNMLALPIHQQLDARAVEFVGEKVRECMAGT